MTSPILSSPEPAAEAPAAWRRGVSGPDAPPSGPGIDLTSVLRRVSDLVVIVTRDRGITYVSPGAARGLGPRTAQRLREDWRSVVHPRDLSRLVTAARAVGRRDGAERTIRIRMRSDDTSWREVELRLTNLEHDPLVEGTLVVARDVTEARREAALSDGVNRVLEHVVHGSPIEESLAELARAVAATVPGTAAAVQVVDDDGCSRFVVQPPEATCAVWSVPIWSGDGRRRRGAIVVHRDETERGEPPRVEELAVVERLATLATVAIERTEEVARLSVLEAAALYAHDAVMILDSSEPGGRVVFLNDAFTALTGYPVAALLGGSFADLLALVVGSEAKEVVAHALGSGEPFELELEVARTDGRPCWAEIHAAPVELDKRRHWIGVAHDVTERVEQQRELREQETFARDVLDSLESNTVVLDGQGRIVRANRQWTAFAAANGGDPDQCGVGVDYLAVVDRAAATDPDLRQVADGIRAVLAGAEMSFEHEYPCHSRTARRWFSMQVSPMVGAAGAVVTHVPVTATHLAEEHVRFQSHLLDEVPAAVMVADAEGSVVLWNDAAETMLGWTADEAHGQVAIEFLVPEERRIRADDIVGSVTAGARWEGELRVQRRDGTELPLHLSVSPVAEPDSGFQGFAAVAVDLSERKRSEAVLAHQATHDALTDLPNRVLLGDRINQALTRARVRRTTVAVLFADLDRFKLINDVHGHDTGDELLVAAARRLTGAIPREHTVGRFAGDEFVVVCEDLHDRTAALAVADTVVAALSEPFAIAGRLEHVSASVGIAFADPDDPADAVSLLRDADAAMYRAKDAGRNRVEVFDATLRAELLRRIEVESALRDAIDRASVTVVYQPVVSLDDGGVYCAEALARWTAPRLGVIDPDEFIPVAEETGLVVPLGAVVLDRALGDVVRWRARTGEGRGVAVNVSARQVADPGFADRVIEALERAGVEPGALVLEMTESVLMDESVSHDVLTRLHHHGVHLAIDDFGTGYSSLAYLSRFPVDVVKIDRSIVADLGRGGRDDAIVAAVLRMAEELDVTVVAEGVETTRQLERLRELGCRYAQGFLLGRPGSPEALP